MEETEIKRLKAFLLQKGYSIAGFERLLQWSNGYIVNREKKYNSTIPNRQKKELFTAFPELSPEWLETGAGEMLRAVPSQKKASTETTSVSGSVDACNSVNDFLAVIEREQQLNLKLVQQYERLLSVFAYGLFYVCGIVILINVFI